MTVEASYTPVVKRIADEVRRLTTGELLALREALASDFDILPPGELSGGVREPRRPLPPSRGGTIYDAGQARILRSPREES